MRLTLVGRRRLTLLPFVAPPAGPARQLCVEARVLTRRESVDKRHKRIRGRVRGG